MDADTAAEHGGPREGAGGPVVRLRLDISYDGTDFSGWADQPGRRTVQGELEAALARVLRLESPRLTVAGRTDAGVHARGQVAHLDVPAPVWAAEADRLLRRLAGVLPPDVRVRAVAAAPEGFDARFSPLYRRYAYRVSDAPGGVDPLLRRHVLWNRRPLDVDRMNEAAAALLGEHDFAAYCRRREGATTVRELLRLDWAVEAEHLYTATVQADAFCHNMVRALVGALLAVGEGRREPDWPRRVLAAGVRDSGVHVIPPHGLTLEEVRYPPPGGLAARARATRRVRTLSAAPKA
ncbi:tRNA pseudouridine(38-40) synthase TruA [Streptomonospora nanhaiensis]|uniref:tRNA pseudouridine(38-40) synthase TruA n=1 Tax=Streptomonospora nanhaiensis TaxID=1323731 RepID=UPI001C392CC2|nr:tRNA pseudouridine(38-40) synthase TruA [Streptomonospora nanhaiensis]MBV2361883.1 tRNA pseudouridine(38-40) synthase TruA [Streptomonospora nanhaiensis]